MTNKSGKFFAGSIVTFLVIIGLITVVLNTSKQAAKNAVAPASMTAEDVAERIKPVAEVTVGEPPVIEAPVVEVASSGGNGEATVQGVCAACHTAGLMESPKLGDAADWAPRIDKGIDTLYDNAINGLNMMPARGGRPTLSDDEVKAAVDYMLSQVQ
jgi:cytochrome c5